ncbi:MAG: hypothetical protein WB626_08620 [Bacteroidota bacterium]
MWILDSVRVRTSAGADSLAGVDTLLFRQDAAGDLYQWGLVAGLLERWEGVACPPGWDRLAAFSLGSYGRWTAAVVDSPAGARRVEGELAGWEYITVEADGRTLTIPAWKVRLRSGDLRCTFWIASSGVLMPRMVEFHAGAGGGLLGALRRARTSL